MRRRTDSWLKIGRLRTDLLDGASLVKPAGLSASLSQTITVTSVWRALFVLLGSILSDNPSLVGTHWLTHLCLPIVEAHSK